MFIAEPTSFAQHFKNSWPVLETSAQWLRGTLCNASLNATIQHVIFAVNPISCRNVDEDHGRSVQGGEKRDVSDALTKVRNRESVGFHACKVSAIHSRGFHVAFNVNSMRMAARYSFPSNRSFRFPFSFNCIPLCITILSLFFFLVYNVLKYDIN